MAISLDIFARTGGAVKELEQFSRKLTGWGKLWETALGGKGGRQAGQNLSGLARGMSEFGKSADRANQRLRAINETLEATVKSRMKLVDAQGKVGRKDRDQYESLLQQEKALAAQQRSWHNIASIRTRMAQNSGLTLGRNGMFSGGSGGSGGGSGGAFGSLVGGGAGAITGLLGGTIAALVAGAGGMAVKGFGAAMNMDTLESKWLPRMRPGGMASMNTIALRRRMSGIGRPLAYNAEESNNIFEAMSAGGSNFGHGLERDSRAAMQFGRMFGLDAGGEASSLATAQKTGAFKPGDAKRFAGMLASEIARTGLGPRAQEVQEATLLLLNQQMHGMGTANPGPIMALQAAFNKTGIPGLTGMAGANVLSRLQESVTNPGDEASEALDFSVFRKMGAKSLYDVKYLQEEGINNRKYLPSLFQTVEGSAQSPQDADIALNMKTKGALSLHVLKMLRQRMGGRLSNFKSGNLQDIETTLGQSGDFLGKGAMSAREAFPSLDIKEAQIVIHEATLRAGEAILPKVALEARKLANAGGLMAGVADSKLPFAQKADRWAGIASKAMGLKPGGTDDRMLHFGAGVVGTVAAEVEKSRQFEKTHPGQKRRLGQILNEAIDHQMQRGFGSMFDGLNRAAESAEPGTGAKWHGDAYLPNGTRRHGRKGSPTNPVPVLPPAGGVDPYAPMGGHPLPADHPSSYHIHVHDHTSDHHVKNLVKQAIHEHQHETRRSIPNSRNQRH